MSARKKAETNYVAQANDLLQKQSLIQVIAFILEQIDQAKIPLTGSVKSTPPASASVLESLSERVAYLDAQVERVYTHLQNSRQNAYYEEDSDHADSVEPKEDDANISDNYSEEHIAPRLQVDSSAMENEENMEYERVSSPEVGGATMDESYPEENEMQQVMLEVVEEEEIDSPFQKDGTLAKVLMTDIQQNENKIIRMELAIGDEVELFGNQTGIVRFVGEVDFAVGNIFGIEFNDGSIGKNDGDHSGVQYFEVAKKKKGIFVRAKQIRRKVPKLVESEYVLQMKKKEEAIKMKEIAAIDKKKKQLKKKGKANKKNMKKEEQRIERMGINLGDDVQIDMGRKGMVAHIGVIEDLHPTHLHYGIALTHGSIGDSDGTVGAVQYFSVEESRGCFVTADKIRKRLMMSLEEKYTQRLEDIYEEFAPSKMRQVKKMIKDSENLHGLYLRICKKYNIEPQPEYRGR